MIIPLMLNSGITPSMFLFIAWTTIYFVFLTFSDNLFTASQSQTFDMWLLISWVAQAEILMVLNYVVSSVYNTYLKKVVAFGISFIYIRNKRGPKLDPCGTPVES